MVTHIKGITMVWLSKTDLSNLNAGEGGAGNVTELKTYDNGRKPYASGQSVRHALREAIERNNPGVFLCTPESPCGDIENCWLCDLFGFLHPKLDEGFNRRWSPIKVTPALGQITNDIVTDLLIRMSDKPKPKTHRKQTDNEQESSANEEQSTRDQRMAYVEMMSNVYRIGFSLDFANIGFAKKAKYDGTGNKAEFKGWEELTNISLDERKKRAVAILDAIGGIADFAKQARNAASLSPDIFIASVHSRYSHRTLRSLECDDDGKVNTDSLEIILEDLKDVGAELFFGFTPGVIKNDDELLDTVKKFGLEKTNPIRALKNLSEVVHNASQE